MFSLKQKKKDDPKTSLKNDTVLTRQEEIEQEEKMRAIAKEKAEKELKEAKKKKDSKNASIGCLVIIGIIIAIYIFSSNGKDTSLTDWKTQDNSGLAYYMSEGFVKEKIKSPSTAKFPSGSDKEVSVIKKDNNQYMIRSYVDSQNSFGATLRTNFIVTIEQVDKDNWKLVDIQFLGS